ncbi:hypothetical protein N431DRAFT_70869 [Stipitochalara longipes BDJ]|nr:hypothetical protein N431DRAFT_70869 [Stipitochalara longipes BDJ]
MKVAHKKMQPRLLQTMNPEAIRLDQTTRLHNCLEELIKHLQDYFEEFGWNTRPFLDGSFANGSNDFSHMIRAQYELTLNAARCLDISEPTKELARGPEIQGSPGKIAFDTLHDTMALLLKLDLEQNEMHKGAIQVPKWLQSYSTEEDFENVIRYGAYNLRIRAWYTELCQLGQMQDQSPPPLPWNSYLFEGSVLKPSPDPSSDGTTGSDILPERSHPKALHRGNN